MTSLFFKNAMYFIFLKEAEDLHWKVSRTRMWMNWVNKGSVLPPPFNLIPNPKVVIHLFRKIRNKCRGFNQNSESRYEVNMNNNNNNNNNNNILGDMPRKVHGFEMVKTKFNSCSHRRDVLMQIVERYLHQRREDSRHEDSENLKDIKAIQELMLQKMGLCVEGIPKSPFKHSLTRLTAAQRTEEACL